MDKKESSHKKTKSKKETSSKSSKKTDSGSEKIFDEVKDVAKKGMKNVKAAIDEINIDTDDLKKDIQDGAHKIKERVNEIAKDIDTSTKDFQEDAKSIGNDFKKGAKDAYDQLSDQNKSKRILVGILAIILGPFGIHKFVLGYTKEGIIMLLITLVSFGFGAWLTGLVGLIEGIIYLTKTDDEFYQTYQVNQKLWF